MDQEIKQEFEKLTSIIQQGLKKHDDEIENLAVMTQRGFDEAKEETSKKFAKTDERIDRLYTNVDGFIHMHQKLDLELTALRGYYKRLEERLEKLETAQL